MGVHDGHRKRIRKLALENGLESMTDFQQLELLLTYAIPRVDTNPISHALLERFGSLSRVLDAAPEDLMEVEGVGESAALLLHLLPQLLRVYEIDKAKKKQELSTTGDIAEYLRPYFKGKTEECAYLLCLNARGGVLSCSRISEGETNTVDISVRRVVELALKEKAVLAVLAHNHVAGSTEPSRADLETTERVKEALSAIGVGLADHVILSGGDSYTSLLERGIMGQ